MGLLQGQEPTIVEGDNILSDPFSIRSAKVVRTIHPIGQGAFYSERLIDNKGNTVFLAVYDCGSQNKKKLNLEIANYFQEGDIIDILFISHLDLDHVSGLQKLLECKVSVKHLALPLIDNNTKELYLLATKGILKQLVQDPTSLFKGSKVIYVKPVGDEGDAAETFEISDNNPEVKEVASGCKLYYCNYSDIIWCYIPYNYEYAARVEVLLQSLGQGKIDVKDVVDADSRKEIKDKYAKICSKGVNNTSLVVYSGGHSDLTKYEPIFFSCRPHDNSIPEGCLYLGDIDLNQNDWDMNLIDDMFKRLNSVKGRIGMIQLPHHGSKDNFNTKLFSIGAPTKVFFASYGNTNSYGHPSARVWEDVGSHGMLCCGVDENRCNTLTHVIAITPLNKQKF